MQTKSLRFETADGAEYVFRLVRQGGTSAPEQFKGTPVSRILPG